MACFAYLKSIIRIGAHPPHALVMRSYSALLKLANRVQQSELLGSTSYRSSVSRCIALTSPYDGPASIQGSAYRVASAFPCPVPVYAPVRAPHSSRQFLGIPGSEEGESKHYQERRLVG